MTRDQLFSNIKKKSSYLCIGLDPDINKLPQGISKDAEGVYQFLNRIIKSTADFCVSYKPNLAFFETMGAEGWQVLEQLISEIPKDQFVIADAKRGDIGNTSGFYADAILDQLGADAITIAPYMGQDSVTPFLKPGKWAVLLALTSNQGSQDFQLLKLENGKYLFEEVLQKSSQWASPDELMFVIGATNAAYLSSVRKIVPDHFLLIPGVGAQGGDLSQVSELGMNATCGLLVNASRSVLYASSGSDFASAAQAEARKMQAEMERCLSRFLPA